jgi:UDP-N-acetylmuramate dehydrogenase
MNKFSKANCNGKKGSISLKTFTTFGIDVSANALISITVQDDLIRFLSTSNEAFYVLGDGSNVLFTKDYDGIILKMDTKGIEILSQDDKQAVVRAKAGENWDDFVRYCLSNQYCGLENLASIPGKVGSAPIQNIGAYGKEVKDYIIKVYAISILDCAPRIFSRTECQFGYRTSIFKQKYKGEYIITDVEFALPIQSPPDCTYEKVRSKLEGVKHITASDVYDAVSQIRANKLPDYKLLGNAGSFFKNPIVPNYHFEELKQEYAFLKGYPVSAVDVKLSAAQLIELAGWKGKRMGEVGVHTHQPLVLVNYGKATGAEVLELATQIQADMASRFGIKLDMEVNII